MKFENKKIKQILLDGAYVSSGDMQKAEEYATIHRADLVATLIAQGFATKDMVGQAIAESLHVPYFDMNSNQPARDLVLKVSEEIAREFRVVIVLQKSAGIVFATDAPERPDLLEKLEKSFPKIKKKFVYSLPEDIDIALKNYHKALETRFSKIISEGARVAPEIIAAIFADAIALNVSDVHLEPTGDHVLVRFRIDGVLRDAGQLPRDQYENILNRIKVQSGIRLDEHFAAQDGAMQYVENDRVIDFRTSIVPTVEGEKVVLRVLNSYVQGLAMSELGLSSAHASLLEQAAQKPFGMILVTGPTGSGKSTTLYSMLKMLNQSDINITTIEDPVEYKLKGVNQIQVNQTTHLTFAKGLRSIVRQDPDIILVGEIRDTETAEISVNAALTGHLLLSTFHANDAATAIPRLLDMNVEPFLLASTLELIVAQRLVRKICDQCKFSSRVSSEKIFAMRGGLQSFFPDRQTTLYQGKGCDACSNSGFKGRIALFEFISLTAEIKNEILKNPSTQDIWRIARAQGAHTLFEDGVDKVKTGVTTIDELLRVAEPTTV